MKIILDTYRSNYGKKYRIYTDTPRSRWIFFDSKDFKKLSKIVKILNFKITDAGFAELSGNSYPEKTGGLVDRPGKVYNLKDLYSFINKQEKNENKRTNRQNL